MIPHSDVPVYASPGVRFEADTVAPRHALAIPRSSKCEILAAFRNAENSSGGKGVFIDPMLRKSYKELPPLP